MLADKLRNDPIWPVAFVTGLACLEAGCWLTAGVGYALALNGAVILFGCWKTA